MKKSELKVGIEYAVCLTPTGARAVLNGRSYRAGKVHKATLVSLSYTEQRYAPAHDRYQSYHEIKTLNGIAVEIEGEKVVVNATIRERDAGGAILYRKDGAYGNKAITRSEQFTYDYFLLENAGCFLMTWADWEAKQKEDAEYTQRRAAQKASEEQARTDGEAEQAERVKALAEALADLGEVVVSSDEYKHSRRNLTDVPDDIYVFTPGDERQYTSDALIHVETTWGMGIDATQTLTGFVVKSMKPAMLERLLGIGVALSV